jgi:hypothetical protein
MILAGELLHVIVFWHCQGVLMSEQRRRHVPCGHILTSCGRGVC